MATGGSTSIRLTTSADGADSLLGGFEPAAEVNFVPAYMEATITASIEHLKDMSPKRLHEISCHEVMHVVLGTMDVFVGQLLKEMPKSKARHALEENYKEIKERTTTHVGLVATALERRAKKK